MTLSGARQPRRVELVKASRDLFALIGVAPLRGRTFTAEEDRPGGAPVALVRDGTLGETITLDDTAYTVVGILPAAIPFANFGQAEVWLPLAADRRYRGGGAVVVTGRLKTGVSLAAAQSEMEAVMRGIRREHRRIQEPASCSARSTTGWPAACAEPSGSVWQISDTTVPLVEPLGDGTIAAHAGWRERWRAGFRSFASRQILQWPLSTPLEFSLIRHAPRSLSKTRARHSRKSNAV